MTFAQLLAAGLDRATVSRRARSGRLHRVHRSVYAVGHFALSQEGVWMAAVLACGPDAVLSHRSAGALWEIMPSPAPVDVTVCGSGGRKRRRGINVHRSTTLGPGDITRRAGIPVTNAVRTLADLRRVLPPKQFQAALREAEFRRLSIGEQFAPDRARSELEARFLRLCKRHRLPGPHVNAPLGPYVVDFLWPDRRMVVEVDGWESHRTRSAFEADRARDVHLKLLGYDVVRVTHRQLTTDPAAVAATVRALHAGLAS